MESKNFFPAMDPPPMVTLSTPLNGTDELFGFEHKNVSAICLRLATGASFPGFPTFLLQMSMASYLTAALKALLKPFGQPSVVGQVLGGMLIGPTGLSRDDRVKNFIFPYNSLHMLETISNFGCSFFLFIVGVKMDPTILAQTGKKAWTIGLLTFFFPMLVNILASSLVQDVENHFHSNEVEDSLPLVGMLHATTTFHGIACFLEDFNLLNSEVGRLALSSSMISGFLSYGTLLIAFGLKQLEAEHAQMAIFHVLTICALAQILFMKIGLKPFLFWMIRRTPEGQPFKEAFISNTIILVLICSFISEVCGQHTYFGPIMFGVIIPAGSILAITVTDKLEYFISYIMLPLYFLACGGKTDLTGVTPRAVFSCGLLALVGTLAKFLAALLPCIFFFKIAFKDAAVLALILSTIGVLDIQFYSRASQLGLIDNSCFTMMNTSAIVLTGLISLAVKSLYDPSARYISHKPQTIQHVLPGAELRILTCVHNQEEVPSIIDLLKLSHPTRERPIAVYLVHLIELTGRAAPLLVSHQNSSFKMAQPMPGENIVNAFRLFERSNPLAVAVQSFTAIAPIATMDHDVCTIAMERNVSLVVLPFHRHWTNGGYIIDSPRLRYVNLKVLNNAPCSVGILIDRFTPTPKLDGPRATTKISGARQVGVMFIGGPDDREALAFAARIAVHEDVTVSVVRFITCQEERMRDGYYRCGEDGYYRTIADEEEDEEEQRLDDVAINEFRLCFVGIGRATYSEEIVGDTVGICKVVRSMETSFDLILVGRRYSTKSSMSEFHEFPELGLLGDILATEDFKGKVSVLVVQQHKYGGKCSDLGSQRFSEFEWSRESSVFAPLNSSKKFTH